MLQSLYIKNYAIIDEVEMNFGDGFNVITGETGAGKSILLGALNLINGVRADTRMLYDAHAKCIVEASFKLAETTITELKKQIDADFDSNEVLIRREISSTGKSRAFINDTPVRLSDIRSTTGHILDIHNQFDTLSIAHSDYQLEMVDLIAENSVQRNAYLEFYQSYIDLKNEIRRLESTKKQSNQDLDFIKFQLEELERIPLDNISKQELIDEHATLSNSERIIGLIGQMNQEFQESEHAISSRLSHYLRQLTDLADVNPQLTEIKDYLEEIIDSLREIDFISNRLVDNIGMSDDKLIELTDTLDHILKLEKKHGLNSIEELLQLRDDYKLRSEGVIDVAVLLEQKRKDLEKMRMEIHNAASTLTSSREKVFDKISGTLQKSLSKLAIPNAKVVLHIRELPDYTPSGLDEIIFSFSANKGVDPQPIQEVASGGELSRLALSVKSMIAELYGVPTLIFDEIDTGISGAVAKRVGEILEQIASSRQVICITHSPQVASRSGRHFLVEKRDTDVRTFTSVKELDIEERIDEIAKMLSEDPPTGSARQNAREMLSAASY